MQLHNVSRDTGTDLNILRPGEVSSSTDFSTVVDAATSSAMTAEQKVGYAAADAAL